jgi:DNA-binding response OmpR family regulator
MGKYRILAIEDDMDVAELLIMFFEGQGYEIYHADTGHAGISLARAKIPNLILLDIMLPDMEGFAVCRELRGTSLTKYIPTIFLTQRNARSDKVSGLELGADDYITKPFDIEELRVRVQKSISRATRDHLHEEVTGLPTGPLIQDEQAYFEQSKDRWNRLNINVSGFEAFRDAYGFLTANDALNLAARVLTDKIIQYGTQNDFIGVIETGKFVIYTYSANVETMAEDAARDFAERATALYKFTDVDQDFVVVDEGTASEKRIPLMHFDITMQGSVAS